MLPFELWLLLSRFAPEPIFSYVRDGNGRIIYAGVANRGSALSSSAWKMVKVHLDSNGLPEHFRLSDDNQVFNDYLTLNYYDSDIS